MTTILTHESPSKARIVRSHFRTDPSTVPTAFRSQTDSRTNGSMTSLKPCESKELHAVKMAKEDNLDKIDKGTLVPMPKVETRQIHLNC